jgi:hypothetical protein
VVPVFLAVLLAAASSPDRMFDCILIDDTSRLTRKLADALNLYESLPLPEYGWLPSHKAWIQIARRRSC